MQEILVEAKNLKKHFQSNSFFSRRDKAVRAVDGISFCIPRGETFGLVGESGCGKSTTGRLLLRLLEPTAGQAFFRGRSIFELEKKELQKLRREMQVIFQDSFSSLNMRMNVGDIISEPLEIHGIGGKGERKDKVSELMHLVGLSPEHAGRFPHEFSGGQRQRVGIARALAVNPLFIVADEPVSSLDVSMRAQILNLMKDLQESGAYIPVHSSRFKHCQVFMRQCYRDVSGKNCGDGSKRMHISGPPAPLHTNTSCSGYNS